MPKLKTLTDTSAVILDGIEYKVKGGLVDVHPAHVAAARSLGFKNPSEFPAEAPVVINTVAPAKSDEEPDKSTETKPAEEAGDQDASASAAKKRQGK